MQKGNKKQQNSLRNRLSMAAGIALAAAGLAVPATAQNGTLQSPALTPTALMRPYLTAAPYNPVLYPLNDYTGRSALVSPFAEPIILTPQQVETLRQHNLIREAAAREFINESLRNEGVNVPLPAYQNPNDAYGFPMAYNPDMPDGANPASDPAVIEPEKSVFTSENANANTAAGESNADSGMTTSSDDLRNGDSGDPASPGSADMSDVPANNGPDMHESGINEDEDTTSASAQSGYTPLDGMDSASISDDTELPTEAEMSDAAQNDTYAPNDEAAALMAVPQDDTARDMTKPAAEATAQPDPTYADPERAAMQKAGADASYRDESLTYSHPSDEPTDVEAAPSDTNANVRMQQSMDAGNADRSTVADDQKPEDPN